MNTSNISRLLIVAALAVITFAATFAISGHTRELAQPESIPPVAAPTPPTKTGTLVGTCNTTKGCKPLKKACKSLKKHVFKATSADGSLGVCESYDPDTSILLFKAESVSEGSRPKPIADVGLASPTKNSAATLYCHGAVFCRKVKNICAALGGDYEPIYDTSGACNY